MASAPLDGKIALITGASRGIGRAIAERFARDGARLVLVYREREQAMQQTLEACQQAGADILALQQDLRRADAAAQICQQALERYGTIQILVNNAGVVAEGLLATLSDEDLEAMLQTNVAGLVRLTRAVLKPMLRQREGCIINLSSVLARVPGRGNAVYAGTKGFVESFTRGLAVEVGRKQVRVNAVAPGVIETEMTRGSRALAGEAIRAAVALGRFGTPEEVAAVVAFVASEAGAYLSGAVLPVDGAYRGT